MATRTSTAKNATSKKPALARQAGIQSLEIGIKVLEALAEGSSSMALKELTQVTRLAPSKLHRYLVSLVRSGMVTQYQASGRYDFGEATRRLGLAALGRLDEFAVTSDHLLKLRDETGMTAMLSVWGGDGPRLVRWEAGIQPLMVTVRIGTTIPLGDSATSVLYLAYLPDAMTRPVLERQRRQISPEERGPDINRAELDQIRAQASVMTRSALIRGIDAVAAPVFNPQGGLSSVIALLAPHERMNSEDGRKAQKAIEATANAISRTLGSAIPGLFGSQA